jgi:hypothetical protein
MRTELAAVSLNRMLLYIELRIFANGDGTYRIFDRVLSMGRLPELA